MKTQDRLGTEMYERIYAETSEPTIKGKMSYSEAEKIVYEMLANGNNRVLEIALFYGVPLNAMELLTSANEYSQPGASVSDLKYAKRALKLLDVKEQVSSLERRIRTLQMNAPIHPSNGRATWKGPTGNLRKTA